MVSPGAHKVMTLVTFNRGGTGEASGRKSLFFILFVAKATKSFFGDILESITLA